MWSVRIVLLDRSQIMELWRRICLLVHLVAAAAVAAAAATIAAAAAVVATGAVVATAAVWSPRYQC